MRYNRNALNRGIILDLCSMGSGRSIASIMNKTGWTYDYTRVIIRRMVVDKTLITNNKFKYEHGKKYKVNVIENSNDCDIVSLFYSRPPSQQGNYHA